MKRIAVFLLAAAMVCGAGAAWAVDLKVKGMFNFVYGVGDNLNMVDSDKKREDDNNFAKQRVRVQVNFIASEYLQGVVQIEIGDIWWGRGGNSGPGSGGALDADGVNVETKHAYLDFLVPDTELSVRMGLQYLALPMGTGYTSPVFGADVAAVTASYKFSSLFTATAFWARPFDKYRNDADYASAVHTGPSLDDEVDMFGLVLPVTGKGWSVTPWFVYSRVGSGSGVYEYILNYRDRQTGPLAYEQNEAAGAWWLGGAFNVSLLDPLVFGLDVMYGSLGNNSFLGTRNADNNAIVGAPFDFETRGWFITAKLDYKLDWGVPGVFGWWSSGDDADDVRDGKYGRIPTVGMDDGFSATSFGLSGNYIFGFDGAVSQTGAGTWGVGLQLADVRFVDDLSHTLRVAYYRGTNDKDLAGAVGADSAYRISGEKVYMTTDDAAWEINFDHQYMIYENLMAYLEIGYITLDMDDAWKDRYGDDAFRAQLGFLYKF